MRPISCLDRLYSTRVLLGLHLDCGSSSRQPRDFRPGSLHQSVQLHLVREVYSMSTLDTFFRSQTYSTFPRTQAPDENVYILDKVNINMLDLHRQSRKGATLTMVVTLSILDRFAKFFHCWNCLLYTSPSPRDS